MRESVSVRAMMAEVLAQLDDVSGAIAEMEAIAGGDDVRADVATRVLVLRGDFDSLGTGVEPAEIEMSIEMDDEEEEEEVSSTWRRKKTMRRRIPLVLRGRSRERRRPIGGGGRRRGRHFSLSGARIRSDQRGGADETR